MNEEQIKQQFTEQFGAPAGPATVRIEGADSMVLSSSEVIAFAARIAQASREKERERMWEIFDKHSHYVQDGHDEGFGLFMTEIGMLLTPTAPTNSDGV